MKALWEVNRSTCHNSVTKGECLYLTTVNGHSGQVQESHLSIQVRVPLFCDDLWRNPAQIQPCLYRVLCWSSSTGTIVKD